MDAAGKAVCGFQCFSPSITKQKTENRIGAQKQLKAYTTIITIQYNKDEMTAQD